MRKLGALIVLFVLASALVAVADTADTCKDLGFTNLTSSTSGEWGSVDFSDDEPTLTLTVLEGFEVRLCVKAGSAQQGLGPELTGWHGEGEYAVAHSSGKELSHYGYEVREIPDDPTTTEGTSSTTSTITTETTVPPSSTTTTSQTTTTTPTSSTSSTPTTTPESSTTVPPAPTTSVPGPTSPSTNPDVLPFTGPQVGAYVAIALALLSVGGLLVWSARRPTG